MTDYREGLNSLILKFHVTVLKFRSKETFKIYEVLQIIFKLLSNRLSDIFDFYSVIIGMRSQLRRRWIQMEDWMQLSHKFYQ